MKKTLVWSLVLALVLSMLGGVQAFAADEKGEIVDGVFRYYEPIDIEVMVRYPSEHIDDPASAWLFEWARQKMNINFVVEGVPSETTRERSPLMFASPSTLPHVLLNWSDLNALSQQTIYGDQEGQLVALQDYITPELMPNLHATLEAMPDVVPLISTLGGNIYNFPRFFQDERYTVNMSFEPLWYDTALFEQLGIATPTTAEELLEALRTIKAADPNGVGAEFAPIGGSWEVGDMAPSLLNAFGFNLTSQAWNLLAMRGGDYKTGTLVNYHTDPLFFEYLKFMNALYSEGLMNQDYYTMDRTQTYAKLSAGQNAVMATFDVYNMPAEGWQNWRILEPLTSAYSDVKMMSYGAFDGGPCYYAFVTQNCPPEQLEAFLRFMDYGYSAELGTTYYYGPKYGEEDGYGIIKGWFMGEDGITFTYQDVVDGTFETNTKYVYNVGPFGATGNKFNRRTDGSEVALYSAETQFGLRCLENIAKLGPYLSARYPGALFDAETATRINDLGDILQEHADGEVAKFIIGTRAVTQEEFDKFVNEMNAIGLEEYMALQTAAFEAQFR